MEGDYAEWDDISEQFIEPSTSYTEGRYSKPLHSYYMGKHDRMCIKNLSSYVKPTS
jgi:hypothetical protein